MIPSIVMYIVFLVLFCTAIVFIGKTSVFTKEEDWANAVMFGLISILLSILSGAVIIGGYLIYIAEHTPK